MYKVLTPAYGRDYKSKKEVQADFDANKDFTVQPEGSYSTKAELRAMGYNEVNIRYGKLRKVAVLKCK